MHPVLLDIDQYNDEALSKFISFITRPFALPSDWDSWNEREGATLGGIRAGHILQRMRRYILFNPKVLKFITKSILMLSYTTC